MEKVKGCWNRIIKFDTPLGIEKKKITSEVFFSMWQKRFASLLNKSRFQLVSLLQLNISIYRVWALINSKR